MFLVFMRLLTCVSSPALDRLPGAGDAGCLSSGQSGLCQAAD